jgi:hypothetical protein
MDSLPAGPPRYHTTNETIVMQGPCHANRNYNRHSDPDGRRHRLDYHGLQRTALTLQMCREMLPTRAMPLRQLAEGSPVEHEHWLAAGVGATVGIPLGIAARFVLNLITARSRVTLDSNAAALAAWKLLAENLQARVTELEKRDGDRQTRVNELEKLVYELSAQHADCQQTNAEQQREIDSLKRSIETLTKEGK